MQDFTTVYTFVAKDFTGYVDGIVAAVGIALIALGFLCWLLLCGDLRARWQQRKTDDGLSLYPPVGLGALTVLSLLFALSSFRTYQEQKGIQDDLEKIYQEKTFQSVEGCVHVTALEPVGEHGHGEGVKINTTQFVLSRSMGTGGYNTTIRNGGVLREGAYVRVYYTDYIYKTGGYARIILGIDRRVHPCSN